MGPCPVCGGTAINAGGYCTRCGTYLGVAYPAPAAPRRSPYLISLIALSVAIVVVAVAIAVVAAAKSGRRAQANPPGGDPAASTSSAIDPCLVGHWTVTRASQQFPVSGVGDLLITLQGGSQTSVIEADGSADDDYTDSRYEGTAGGHTYTLEVNGTAHYMIRTANGTITFRTPTASGSITATVDGLESTSIPLSVTSDPVQYTCSGDTATEHTANFDVTLSRSS
jgi:hypothetical protein